VGIDGLEHPHALVPLLDAIDRACPWAGTLHLASGVALYLPRARFDDLDVGFLPLGDEPTPGLDDPFHPLVFVALVDVERLRLGVLRILQGLCVTPAPVSMALRGFTPAELPAWVLDAVVQAAVFGELCI
jgi:hypothetical protein